MKGDFNMHTKNKTHMLLIDYIKSNQNKFYKVAYMYTKSKEDALDVVQEAILKALKSSNSILQKEYLSTWFYKILINTAITYINRRKITYPLEFASEIVSDKAIEKAEILDLYDAIDKLDEIEKSIIILRFFEDLKFKDISDITGLNINTIKTKTYVILDKLKIQLECEVDDS